MIEVLALVCFIFVGNPRWVANYVYSYRYWLKYYQINKDDRITKEIVRFRAKNIARIRKAKFKAMK
jgi:hypothetical protein